MGAGSNLVSADPNSVLYQTTYRETKAEIAAEQKVAESERREFTADYDRRAFAADRKKGDGGRGRVRSRSKSIRCGSCLEFYSITLIRDYEPVVPPDACPRCGAPRHAADSSPYVKSDPFDKPYFDTDLGPNVKGATYVRGKGVYIQDRTHANRVAALNGRPIRPEYR